MLPLLGTTAGSGFVLFVKNKLPDCLQRILSGFAAGVMVAASVWSLLLPSIDYSSHLGRLAFIPATVGFLFGIALLQMLARLVRRIQLHSQSADNGLHKTAMLVLSVTLHNIPEGMAVGVAYAGYLTGQSEFSLAAALILSLGIAIQNVPEGSIISLPLKARGMSRSKALGIGILSGIVEPVGALLTILAAGIIVPILPYLLSLAAGAMFFVVVEELIPDMTSDTRSGAAIQAFTFGFCIMMILDIAFG